MVEIIPVPTNYIPRVWPDIEKYVDQALERGNGEMWKEDVYQELLYERMQAAIIAVDGDVVACVIFEVVNYPRKRALRLVHGAGSHLHTWGPYLNDFMQARAEEVDADLIEVQGRLGWMKYLKNLVNAKTRMVMMTRPV